MALDGRLLARARERLAARRAANIAERDRREAEVYAAAPEIRRIDAELRALVGRVVELAGRGTPDTAGLEAIRRESLELCAKKAETLAIAYDRTVLRTGALKWNYMDKILKSWNDKGLFTPEAIEAGDPAARGKRRGPAPAASNSEKLADMDKMLTSWSRRKKGE